MPSRHPELQQLEYANQDHGNARGEQAVQAVRTYGPARGLVLAGWRLLRCNPWSHGGYDPVEEQRLFRPSPSSPGVGGSESPHA